MTATLSGPCSRTSAATGRAVLPLNFPVLFWSSPAMVKMAVSPITLVAATTATLSTRVALMALAVSWSIDVSFACCGVRRAYRRQFHRQASSRRLLLARCLLLQGQFAALCADPIYLLG